nr:annexin-2 receptor-like [Desmodus rotundus]XP_053774291.1 annexin-2 receptor-like [Desmodus rotundus]XP_053774293.1 annexin-2 receptor-like [Desmodus rotundus]XP_053774300.1 annexin-2 receptor-like [Desmodus rotundus]XP_053774307.1 annexin-2 receptor-like [Desmodus rotundus]XP_053774315.1 annexin-2 receptor-like [Desmodus rotundus]XP_053774320.1 annexin-2 receptor-like [Desmodus rotundus]
MEQHFLDVVNPAWDAAECAPHSRRPWWPISEDSAPRPLPLYPPRPSVSLETLETLETPAAAAREPEPAEESASQPIAQALRPNAGDGLQIAENVEGARPAERRPSRRPAGWCPHPDFSGCLRWIRRAVCTLSRAAAGCCAAFLDVKEP